MLVVMRPELYISVRWFQSYEMSSPFIMASCKDMNPATACQTLVQVMAKCCLEAQIKFLHIFQRLLDS